MQGDRLLPTAHRLLPTPYCLLPAACEVYHIPNVTAHVDFNATGL
jgi:hypothetical protein